MSKYSDAVLSYYAACPAATVARLGRALEAAEAAMPAVKPHVKATMKTIPTTPPSKTAAATDPDSKVHEGAKASEDMAARLAGFQLQADAGAGDVDERLALAAQDIADQRGCDLAKASSLALAEDADLRADYEALHVHAGTVADPKPEDPARAALAATIAAELTAGEDIPTL